MKRWAVFDTPTYYPSGGMGDFVAAFDTREDAEAYIQNTPDSEYCGVEDMEEYLSRPSPRVPTEDDYRMAMEERQQELQERRARMSPLDLAIEDSTAAMIRQLQKQMYGRDGE